MLTASIKILNIDYESTIQHVYPLISKEVVFTESKSTIIRLLQKLDSAALPVLTSMLYRVPKDTKDELLVRSLNAFSMDLIEKISEVFKGTEFGRCLTIGALYAYRKDEIHLVLDRIDVDYPALLNTKQVNNAFSGYLGRFSGLAKKAAGVAFSVAPDALEQKGLELLLRDENKERLLTMIKSVFQEYGIMMDLTAIQIAHEIAHNDEVVEASQPFVLTEKMENDILNALAGYLRDSVPNTRLLSD